MTGFMVVGAALVIGSVIGGAIVGGTRAIVRQANAPVMIVRAATATIISRPWRCRVAATLSLAVSDSKESIIGV